MSSVFSNLPNDILIRIISYTNTIKFRNGKYIDTIPNDDIRYTLLSKIPKPISVKNSEKHLLYLTNKKNAEWVGCLLTYYFSNYTDINGNKCIHNLFTIQNIVRKNDGFEKYYAFGMKNGYIFTSDNKWEKIINYTM